MSKISSQQAVDRLAIMAAKINKFKITLTTDDQGTTKELTLQEWLQTLEAHELVGVKDELAALTKLVGTYAEDVDGNLDVNASVIKNLSIAASNIQAILDREKDYAKNDFSNVNLGAANAGKILKITATGDLEQIDEVIKDLTHLTTRETLYAAIEKGKSYLCNIIGYQGIWTCIDKQATSATLYGEGVNPSGRNGTWRTIVAPNNAGSFNLFPTNKTVADATQDEQAVNLKQLNAHTTTTGNGGAS